MVVESLSDKRSSNRTTIDRSLMILNFVSMVTVQVPLAKEWVTKVLTTAKLLILWGGVRPCSDPEEKLTLLPHSNL